MISQGKRDGALRAIHWLMVRARMMAYETKNKELIQILDAGEHLPLQFLSEDDRTDYFREQLEDLKERYPHTAHALHVFDK